MSDPHIQIVDANDHVVGAASIELAHAQGLPHRVVRIMIFDSDGNVLLQKRTPTISNFPNCWDNSAAGHVDENETYEQAAKRELREEVGLEISLREVGYYKSKEVYQDLVMNRFTKVYEALLEDRRCIRIDQTEVAEVKWFSLKEARRIAADPDVRTPGLQDVLTRFYI